MNYEEVCKDKQLGRILYDIDTSISPFLFHKKLQMCAVVRNILDESGYQRFLDDVIGYNEEELIKKVKEERKIMSSDKYLKDLKNMYSFCFLGETTDDIQKRYEEYKIEHIRVKKIKKIVEIEI